MDKVDIINSFLRKDIEFDEVVRIVEAVNTILDVNPEILNFILETRKENKYV